MKNLVRAWKFCRDNNKRTGASPCFAPFEQIMEEIFWWYTNHMKLCMQWNTQSIWYFYYFSLYNGPGSSTCTSTGSGIDTVTLLIIFYSLLYVPISITFSKLFIEKRIQFNFNIFLETLIFFYSIFEWISETVFYKCYKNYLSVGISEYIFFLLKI